MANKRKPDSDDELNTRFMALQCTESTHYKCSFCNAWHSGSHDWKKVQGVGDEPWEIMWVCSKCAANAKGNVRGKEGNNEDKDKDKDKDEDKDGHKRKGNDDKCHTYDDGTKKGKCAEAF